MVISFSSIFLRNFFLQKMPIFGLKMPIFGLKMPIFGQKMAKNGKKMAKNGQNIAKILKNIAKLSKKYHFLLYWCCIGLQRNFFMSYWYRVDFWPKNDSRIGIGLENFWKIFLSYWYRDGFFGKNFWILVLYRHDQNSKCRTLVVSMIFLVVVLISFWEYCEFFFWQC